MHDLNAPASGFQIYPTVFDGFIALIFFAFSVTVYFQLADAVWRHLLSQSFEAVPGVVTRCGISRHEGADGEFSDVDIQYTYEIHDKTYHGTVIRCHKLVWDHPFAMRFVAAHPVGSKIMVYADPSNPANSVLMRDTDGSFLYIAMFLLPFHVVWIGTVAAGFEARKYPSCQMPAYVGSDQNGVLRIRWNYLIHFGITFVVIFILSIFFILGIPFHIGSPPSLFTMTVAWLILIAVPTAVYFTIERRGALGYYEIVIDRRQRTLTVPRSAVRGENVVMRFQDIESVRVGISKPDSEGNVSYPVFLIGRDSTGLLKEIKLVHWEDKEISDRLVAVIQKGLGKVTS